MPIHELFIKNFKGISDGQAFEIRPITLFIGPNSSGKSSCIHALACLAQTLKLSNNDRPIILDDEFAQVHLGRFIEVIHSKSYSDVLELGVDVGEVGNKMSISTKSIFNEGDQVTAKFTYKSTKRTQDVTLDKASLTLGKEVFSVKPLKNLDYEIVNGSGSIKFKASRKDGFFFTVEPKKTGPTPEFFETYVSLESLQKVISQRLRNTLYLGPFRQAPLRRYPTRGANPREVGAEGEAAITMLANECAQTKSRTHTKQISRWLKELGLAKSVDVSRVGSSDLFDVALELDDGVSLPIADLGYGLSQVLPVLVQCSFAPIGATLLFEQPELHLHSLAAKRLARVFVETIKEKKAHIVAETHSPDLFWEIMSELRLGNIKPKDIIAYKVRRESGKSVITEIKIEEVDGEFDIYDPWQTGLTK